MKHPLSTTSLLLTLFLATQIFGLFVVSLVMPVSVSETGEQIVGTPNTIVGPPPETSPMGALWLILIGVGVGTALIMVLVKLRSFKLWKIWFMLASAVAMMVTFGVLFGPVWYIVSAILALILAYVKIFRVNPLIHNITEVCIYPGIAVLFYDILSVSVMFVLLALISLYDIIAVRGSGHMVSMAKFQSESKVFAGLSVPKKVSIHPSLYKLKMPTHPKKTTAQHAKEITKNQPMQQQMAILGGGDVAFPLLFAAVFMKELVSGGLVKEIAFAYSSIVSLCAMLSLAALFVLAEKGKFYPAMPAVSAGCLAGWLIVLLLV